jgi:hypothetical protein
MANTVSRKAETARKKSLPGGAMGYETAARKYVNAGLGQLGLKPNQKDALRSKLIPIVARQMGAERGRTATRAAGIAKRETVKSTNSAAKKILGK